MCTIHLNEVALGVNLIEILLVSGVWYDIMTAPQGLDSRARGSQEVRAGGRRGLNLDQNKHKAP